MDLSDKNPFLLLDLKLFCHLSGQVLYADSQPWPDDLARFDEVAQELLGHVNGNGKADPRTRLNDHGIDADHLSVNVA